MAKGNGEVRVGNGMPYMETDEDGQPIGEMLYGFGVFLTDEEIIIRIDRNAPPKLSKSGKNMLLATSGGNMPFPLGADIAKLGLNLYVPA